MNDSRQLQWEKRADQIARRITLAWWLEKLTIPLVLVAATGACALLFLRKQPGLPYVQFAWITTGAALLITAIIVWYIVQKNRESRESVYTRIESSMRLRNSLSAANAGVSVWPDVPSEIDYGHRWNWKRVFTPLLAALLFLLCGALIPITPTQNDEEVNEPHSWAALDDDLTKLSQDEAVEEPYIEEMKKRLEELRKQNPEEWFSGSSLEATDSLREHHENETARVERELNKMVNSLEVMQNSAAESEAKKRAQQDMQEALDSLRNGTMKPNQELMDKIGKIDPSKLRQLSKEQMEQLRQAMRENAEKLSQAQGGSKGKGDWEDELMAGDESDPGGQSGNGPHGQGPGQGDISRGPGTDPNVLGKESHRLRLKKFERLDNQDFSQSLPGDLLQLQDGEHDVDQTPIAPSQGGAISNAGQGGDRIYKDNLLPSEKKALKNFLESGE